MVLHAKLRASRRRSAASSPGRVARHWIAGLVGAGILTLGLVAPASATTLVQDHYSVSGTAILEICGGTFQYDFAFDGTFSFVFRGTSPAPYGADRTHTVEVYTNAATGKTMTVEFRGQFRDVTITIDDQTNVLTLTGRKSGTVTVNGPEGTLLFREAGTFLATVLLDDGGTPEIPDDDTFLADLGKTFVPPGRTGVYGHDFCTELVAATS